jgi:hypothetical protein
MATTINRPVDQLRAALKQAGFNTRRVSVRADHSTLQVTIRDASISLTQIEAIAGPFESIRRCEATGEILQGGNRYVDIKYDPALVKPLKVELAALLVAAPFDAYVSVPGGFRALKVTGPREEVRLAGPWIDDRYQISTSRSTSRITTTGTRWPISATDPISRRRCSPSWIRRSRCRSSSWCRSTSTPTRCPRYAATSISSCAAPPATLPDCLFGSGACLRISSCAPAARTRANPARITTACGLIASCATSHGTPASGAGRSGAATGAPAFAASTAACHRWPRS